MVHFTSKNLKLWCVGVVVVIDVDVIVGFVVVAEVANVADVVVVVVAFTSLRLLLVGCY